ncbi:MAG: hypothetical protein GX761_03045 [Gammaproteobacteria bacterium]|nr:hypothetical protein [Gammaproteobacteria bacterium]
MDLAHALEQLATPATERQLRYAANLGQPVRGDESRAEIGMKIELGEREQGYREAAPAADAVESARYFGHRVLSGSTTGDIMGAICRSLLVPGREFDLARWYVFRVCKQRRVWAWGWVNSPDHWLVLQIAQEIVASPATLRSVQAEASCSGLVAFSTVRDDAGLNGSSNAAAYRFVIEQIRQAEQAA